MAISIAIFFVLLLFIPLPNPLFPTNYSTILTAADGSLLSAAIAEDEQWRFPPSDSIPAKFQTAILLFEDEYFHYHPGINPFSIVRAVRQNIQAGSIVSGGSTISMQTVRMAYKNQQRTYFQKVYEILASLKLELQYSKESILKKYVDHAPFGGNIVGLNAASWRYYGRPPHLLSWAEVATLAILPNSPSSIFPGKNDILLLKKRDFLLNKLHERGYLTSDDLLLSKAEQLPSALKPLPNHAYHLLHRAKVEYGGNKKIPSTLDATLQRRTSAIVQSYSEEMSENQINNAAALIVEISTGKTLAYVGNTNVPGDHGQHVDVVTAKRSPGSLLKPILYAAALDEGLISPSQLLPDIPLFYRGFAPKNFDKEYRGAVPASEALTSSLNVPFVHLLIEYGYEKFHQKLVEMGFTSFTKPAGHYGLSIILGGAETSLWEVSNVYSSMARANKNFMSRPINKGYSMDDYIPNTYVQGNDFEPSNELSNDGHIRVPSIAKTFEVMQEVKRPEEEFGWEYFGSSRPISWKTGTSYGFRDGWAIGLNGKYLVSVWVGNADGEGRAGLTGIRAAAPLLFQLFGLVDGDEEPDGVYGAEYQLCKESGMLASNLCPNTIGMQLSEYMASGRQCIFHKRIHLNREKTHRVNSSCYEVSQMAQESWFILPPVQSWYYKKRHPNYRKLPAYHADCLAPENDNVFDLIYPSQFTKVYIPLEQDGVRGEVIFEAAHEHKQSTLYWHIDDEFMGMTTGNHQIGVSPEKGIHYLTLIDELGNELRRKFEIIN